jgi:multidrug efflux system membrane fusion protein
MAVKLAIAAAVVGAGAYYLKTRGAKGDGHDKGSGAEGAGGSAARATAAAPGATDRVVPVTVALAQQGDTPIWIEGLGSVSAAQTVTVHVLVDGRLDKILFREGDFVKAGQVLAQVDPRPFQASLESAKGALVRDKAQLVMNQQLLNRNQDLYNQKLVAEQTVEQYQGAVGQFQGSVTVDQAAIDTAALQLDYAAVKSPVDGITGVRQIDAGNIVHATDATGLVTITAVDPAAVYFVIPEDRLPDVLAAQAKGPVKVHVMSRDGSQPLGAGKVLLLDNQVNQTTATLRLKALVRNPDHLLWPNAFVKACMLTETRPNAITIPGVAVQQGPIQPGPNNTPTDRFVYIIKDGVATMTPIVVSLITGDTAIISAGITKGDQVVVEGQNQLRNGGHVDVAKPGNGSGASDATPVPVTCATAKFPHEDDDVQDPGAPLASPPVATRPASK